MGVHIFKAIFLLTMGPGNSNWKRCIYHPKVPSSLLPLSMEESLGAKSLDLESDELENQSNQGTLTSECLKIVHIISYVYVTLFVLLNFR